MPTKRLLIAGSSAALLASAAVIALALSTSRDPDDAPLPTHGPLDGLAFVAVRVVGRELVPGSTLRLSFAEGRFSAYAGCNDSDGGYELRHGRLVTLQVTQSLWACGTAIQDQDDWLEHTLDGAAVARTGSTLELRSHHTRIEFASDRSPSGP